jgi:glucose/arabinose dehydrogenase
VAALAACAPSPSDPPPDPTPTEAGPVPVVDADVRVIAKGLAAPWGLAFLPDGTALVTERNSGRVLRVTTKGRVTEVQRVTDAHPEGEGGLLGIAVSPTYATDRLVYVYYTSKVDSRVARFRLGETPKPILTGVGKNLYNNGGRIAFGPDGLLYIGTGDADDLLTPDNLQSRNGKILRTTPDGAPAPGNPFPGSAVYSYGHRNVQGLAWDRSGRLFASEFGDHQYDELNLIQPGKNYGWPDVEGMGTDPKVTNPVATWSPREASPSGIAIVGDHVYAACLAGRRLQRVNLDGTNKAELLVSQYGRLRTVAVAPDGALWVLTSNRDGRGVPDDDDDRILRVAPS